MSVLDEIADEVFPAQTPEPASAAPKAAGSASVLDEVADEVFEGKPPKAPEPGFLSKAADAVTSAVTAIPKAIATGFKSVGPTVAPGAAAPPKSVALPQAPAEDALKATSRSASVIPEPVAPAPPVPIKLGPVAGLEAASAEAAKAPLLEKVAGTGRAPFVPPAPEKPAPGGMLGRVAAKAGLVDPEAAKARAAAVEYDESSVMAKPEGVDPGWWQVQQDIKQARRIVNAMPNEFANRVLFGIPNAIKDTFGFDSPQARAPQTTGEAITAGTGDLAGFIVGPAKAAHALLATNIGKWLAPQAGNALGTIMAKSVANEAATLAVASGLAHAGDYATADSLKDAYHQMGEHVQGGAVLGAAFGGLGNVIPANTLAQRAARLGVGLGVLDVVQGTSPGDDRALAQKIYDYGLNTYFLWSGKDPRALKATLEQIAAARGKGTTPEAVLKSVYDKAMERAAKLKDVPAEPGVPETGTRPPADLKALLEEELAAASGELRSAADLAVEKTGGPIAGPSPVEAAPEILLAGGPRPAARPSAPRPTQNVGIPGQVPTIGAGPVRILGPTGRPADAAPAPVEGLKSAQELAAEKAKGIRRTPPPAPQAPPAAAPDMAPSAPPAAAAASADRPVSGLAFKDYVEAAGKKWPLTAQDPDYARLRFEFGDLKKGLYEARPSPDGRWAVINRKTGEEVDHLPSGAKAQLEANRLNSVVTLDAWRNAQVPQAPVRMVLPERKTDLAAKPAPEPTVEPGTPAAQQKEAEAATVEGPPPSAEPPAAAKAPAQPAAAAAVGKAHEIRVPAGSKYQIRYEAVEAEDLVPSHDPKSFTKDPRYPDGVQNRPYHSDKSEQAKVIRQAQDLEPLFLVRPSPDSSGTPILAPDSNVVLSGNSRTMTLLRTLGTEGFQKYRQALTDMAPALGLDPNQIAGMRNPVVVRRLVGTDTTPEFYRRFAKETNETFIQALNTQAAAVSQGKAMQPETMEWIAGAVDTLGENATLRDFLRSGRDREIIRRFIQDGVFTERDLNRYIDPKTTQLNEDGKRLVERAILGNAIPDPDLLGQAPASIVAKIERSLGALAKIKGRGEAWDLGKDLEDAVRTVVQVQASGAGGVDALRRQGSLLEEAGPTSRADTLADALLRMKPNDFKAAIGRYAEEAQRDVRGQETLGFAKPATPEDAFRTAFGGGEPARKVAEPVAPYGSSGRSEGATESRSSIASEAGGDLKTSPTSQPPYSQERVEGRQVSAQTEESSRTTRQTAPSTAEGGATRYSGVREPAPDPALRFSSIDPASERIIRQEHSDINALMFWAERVTAEVPETAKEIAKEVHGAEFRGGRAKKVSRALEKIKRLGKPAQTIGDYYAMTWTVDRVEDAPDLIRAFERHGWRVIEDENFMDKPKAPDNWRARFVQVEVAPGFSAEVRIVPKEVGEALDLSHAFLDIYRDENVPLRAHEIAKEGSRAVNDEAWARYEARGGKRATRYPGEALLKESIDRFRQIAEAPETPDKFKAFARNGLAVAEKIQGKHAERRRREAEPPEDFDLPSASLTEALDAGGARGGARAAGGLMMRLMGGVRETRTAYRPVVESEPFKRWFGKSKVTDADGTPRILHHGTNNPGFDAVDPAKLDPSALVGRGFYMTESPEVAGGTESSRGYAAKGARDSMSPEMATAIVNEIRATARWKRLIEGDDKYLAPFEKERAKSLMRVAEGDANAFGNITELRGQPYNFKEEVDAALKNHVSQGAVYPLYARIENPFNYDGYLTREQVRRLVDTAKRMLPGETGRVQLESAYETMLGSDKNVPAMEAVKGEMREIAARNGFGTVEEQRAAEERHQAAWLAWKNKDVNSAGYKAAGDEAKAAADAMKTLVPGFGKAVKGPEAARYSKLADQLNRLGTWQHVTGAPAERVHEHLKAFVVANTKRGDGVNVNDVLKAAGFDGITHVGGKVTGGKPHQVWVAFDPEQVKSATGNRGTFDPESPSMVAEEAGGYGTQAPTFYSALERAITSKMPERASAEQILAITKTPGVKPEEVKWTGLDDFLASKPTHTKAEVMEFLRENAVTIAETVKGQISAAAQAEARDLEKNQIPKADAEMGSARFDLEAELDKAGVLGTNKFNISLDRNTEASRTLWEKKRLPGLTDRPAPQKLLNLAEAYWTKREAAQALYRKRHLLENPDELKQDTRQRLNTAQAASDNIGEVLNDAMKRGGLDQEFILTAMDDRRSMQAGMIRDGKLFGADKARKRRVKALAEEYWQAEDLVREAEKAHEASRDLLDPTKFQKYTLPGGQTYRELLLTLPARTGYREGDYEAALKASTDYVNAERRRRPESEWDQVESEPEAMRLRARATELGAAFRKEDDATYKSNHWDEPNVLASIRFNDRTDKAGQRVLFIEEIQSDWHQAGRKRGYHDEQVRHRDDLIRKIKEIEDRQSVLYGEMNRARTNVVPEEFTRLTEERNALKEELRDLPKSLLGVPDAPFKKTWHELAMKRMLRYAAEHGYDRVAWTTGEQQAERYDLSKQLESVTAEKIEGGKEFPDLVKYDLSAKDHEGRFHELGFHTASELEGVVGKDLAKAITAQAAKKHRYSGLDLKVGGEGMKGFYDKILPEFAAKYGKKWGATVGETALRMDPLQLADMPGEGRQRNEIPVHSIDVTPEMRRSVLIEGQPLFEKGTPYGDSPVIARDGATTGDRAAAQMALFDLEQVGRQPVQSVRVSTGREQPKKANKPRGEEAGAGVRTTSRLIDEFKAKGFIDFRGQTLRPGRELEDLAEIGQVARDPRYETFRYFYTKGNEIVGSEAFSSRVPGSTMYLEGMERRAGIRTVAAAESEIARRRTEHVKGLAAARRRMERLGADGYYIMHNHPSGRPEASRNDIAVTEYLADAMPGLKGHVIINSGQYGVIEVAKERRLRPKVGFEETGQWVGTARVEDLPSARGVTDPLLGRVGNQQINSAEDLAQLGRNLKAPENYVTLVHRDSAGKVRAVQEMPVALFLREPEASDFIRGQQRAFGAADTFAVFKPTWKSLEQSRKYVEDGVLRDAIAPGAEASESAWNYLANKGKISIHGEIESMPRNTRTVRVQEEPTGYGDFERLKPETRKKLVAFGREVMGEGTTDFASWAKAMREKLGEKSAGTLPGAWAALMQEQARTQAKPAAKAEEGGGKPPAPPKDIPQSAAPIEGPPELTSPQLKLGLHKDVVDVARELFEAGKLIRDPKTLISDQILDAITSGKLRIEDMAGILEKRGMTFTQFGEQMFRPAITDAAKRLGALGQLQRRLNELEEELGGSLGGGPKKPGEGGGPDGKEREKKIKTLADVLEAAGTIDPVERRALSYWRRADNVRRGLLVTQLATSVRNFTTQVGRLGIDVMDQGLQGGLQRAFGKEVTQHPADAMGALMEVFTRSPKESQARVEALLEGLPAGMGMDRLFGNYASDLNVMAKKQGAGHLLDTGLRGAEKAVEVANTVNRFQEYVVRRAVFQAELGRRLERRGIDLEQAIKDKAVRGKIPFEDIRGAIDKALEMTFSATPKYGTLGYDFIRTVNRMPGATFLLPFPRFMVNALKFYLEFSPVGFGKLLTKAERAKFAAGDMKTLSRAIIGSTMLAVAYAIRAMQDDDTKWYEVRLPGMERTLDTRAYNPFAAYLFVADVIMKIKNGNLYGGNLAQDTIKNILGANVRGGFGLQAVDSLVDGLADVAGNSAKVEKWVAEAGGRMVAGLLTPLQTFTDVWAEFSPEDQVVRNTREAPFTGPIKNRVPGTLLEAMGVDRPEERSSPTRSEPVRRESPGLRQIFGLTLGTAKNDFEKELDRLQFSYRDVLPSQGDARLDNALAAKMGPLAEREGERIVNSARYQNLGEIGKRLEMKAYLQRLRKKAKMQAMQDREYREVAREVKAGTSKERLKEMSREEKAGLR